MYNRNDSRSKILLTASRLFLLQGYHATGLNQIIMESGSPKGSLYYYFPNGKEELAIEAFILTRDFIEQKIKEILDEIDDPVEALQSMVYGLAREINNIRRSSLYR